MPIPIFFAFYYHFLPFLSHGKNRQKLLHTDDITLLCVTDNTEFYYSRYYRNCIKIHSQGHKGPNCIAVHSQGHVADY